MLDKNAIKKFAIQARRDLIDQIIIEANLLGIDENGVADELPSSTNEIKFYKDEHNVGITGDKIVWRDKLVKRLNEYAQKTDWQTAFKDIVEEAAYTWFNRIIAVRFMEVNDYLPSRVRVLSSEEGRNEPDIIYYAEDVDLQAELNIHDESDLELIYQAKSSELGSDLDKMYQMLFFKQVDALNKILPGLFELTSDYLKLLFTPRYNTGVIKNLIDQIPERFFDVQQEGQVEIIGWLYQFYNTEPKDEVISLAKSHKYRQSQIASATQIFTPDWIVQYMVQNSLGKYWIHHLLASGDSRSEREIAQSFQWKYYMEDASQPEKTSILIKSIDQSIADLSIQKIKLIDPAMGSGHILVYAFDLLIQIYKSEGYSNSESVKNILKNNLYGLDIDYRAYQLSYFAIMMKARSYYRNIFKKTNTINLFNITSTSQNLISYDDILSSYLDSEQYNETKKILMLFNNNSSLGSLIIADDINLELIKDSINILEKGQKDQLSFEAIYLISLIKKYYKIAKILKTKFDIIIANPPYMGSARMNEELTKFAKKNFPNSKSDLFSMFLEKWSSYLLPGGYNSMVTMQSWMFLSSFEKMRISLLNNYTISNLMHMENNVMGIAFGTAVTILRNIKTLNFIGTYHQIKTKDVANSVPSNLPIQGNRYNRSNQANFAKIPGSPIAYWASANLIHDFEIGTKMEDVVDARVGLQTGDNNKFLRQWFEVAHCKIKFDAVNRLDALQSKQKWFPHNKGGEYRKWYGNYDYIVNWENDGYDIRNFKWPNGRNRAVVRNEKYYFREAITWSDVTSGNFSIRYRNLGSIHDVTGMCAFTFDIQDKKLLFNILGLLNSSVGNYILNLINPTIHLPVGSLKKFPLLKNNELDILETINFNINISKTDWDSFETSWDFKCHPFLNHIAEHNLSPP
ncbi:BREX-1 system adenine-specific DNA-methyltransferase PglX [Bombilactobacillus bombi]|uniref:BREX-1 system adenine-specific DNA-methyltransferase PglX n=1 Tax=Bombilactobacillus bombi TaxID=1303590 RepID=UPI0015E5DDD1|nr:BREX-1 system adenine-specific DNA-methyltransferase PglX [Bombilactobacillus bombi]MBA1433799.1 BREX-1 system adenine-specific DNA-methyltransferase PglX [Bombilactobacillus bombi]